MMLNFLLVSVAVVLVCSAVAGGADEPVKVEAREPSNPVLPGYFADPSVVEFDGKYYVYATVDPWGDETLGCWESSDFKAWTYRTLNWPTKKACTSATSGGAKVWAPSVVRGGDGRFYMYVSVGSEVWAGRAQHPLGPWENALADGRPLIPGNYRPGFHMIDAEAFVDDDGTPYLYWGSGLNWVNGKCWVVRLKPDMVTFDSAVKDVTPANYFEGPFMIKRNGTYYLMYSHGNTTTDTYQVRYATGDNPFGPFTEGRTSPFLKSDAAAGVVSPGHHAVFRKGGEDYVVFHVASVPKSKNVLRQICVERMTYGPDGTILPVKPTPAGALPLQAAIAAEAGERKPQSSEAAPVRAFHTWAPTPPMGWNSWDCFGTAVTEEQVKANADYMAEHLKRHGWEYVTVDIQWYEPDSKGYDYRKGAPLEMDGHSRLVPAVKKFPSAAGGRGFKPLAEYVHGKGLKFAVHMMRGIPRQAVERNTPILGTDVRAADIADRNSVCTWNPDMYGVDATKPGAQAYYDSIFKLLAEWEVDFVKVDDLSRPYAKAEVELIRKAIDKCGRPMVLSTSPGETPLDAGPHVGTHANMWRMSDDFWDKWQALEDQFARCRNWAPHAGDGRWPDADMLPLGNVRAFQPTGWTNFKPDEQYTLMTLWSITRSPLIFGGHLPKNDAFTLSLITNDEVLAANKTGRNPRQVYSAGGLIVWASDVAGSGDKYVAVFNTRDRPAGAAADAKAPVPVRLADLGLAERWTVRDLWARADLPQVSGTLAAQVPYHGAAFYRLSPAAGDGTRAQEAAAPPSVVATASSTAGDAFAAGRVTDRNYATRWAPAADAAGPHWVQLDLGRETPTQWCVLRPEFPTRTYRLTVAGSADGQAWTTLADLSRDGARGSPVSVPLAGTWRYVRVTFAGNMKPTDVALWEMAVE